MVKERCIRAAILLTRGKEKVLFSVPQPYRHHHIGWFYGISKRDFLDGGYQETQGFVTNTGRFVGRKEGLHIAEQCNQIIKKHPSYEYLYSEDMWGTSSKSRKFSRKI